MNIYAQRRKQLEKLMGPNAIALIPSQQEYLRAGDSHYPFRQSSDLYYLTGFTEPEAMAVILTPENSQEFILFNRPRDAAMELWTGKRAGQSGAVENFHADRAFDISEFEKYFVELAEKVDRIYLSFSDSALVKKINQLWQQLRAKIRSGTHFPQAMLNLDELLHEMRLFKSADEIKIMQQAADISVAAHKRAMRACRPGKYEYQLEAEIVHECMMQGAQQMAYPSIVGAGNNSCVLHYIDNNCEIKDGDIVLIDAGCEYQLYASDLTRTFPANGKFSPEQKAIYEIVLRANVEAINAIKPGLVWNELQKITDRVITEGLVELGLLKGNITELLEKQACREFYPHRSGHWLGLDVHDVGRYRIAGEWRQLQPGMVFTVEPGIYIPEHVNVPEKWRRIGVRIEDDVLVTETGFHVFSEKLPKNVADIEALMKS